MLASHGATVGWFYALDEDVAAFEELAGTPVRTFSVQNTTTVVREYREGAHQVLAIKMGSGCMTTAVNVARVTALRRPDYVISTGPAGALDASLKVGQWVKTDEVVAWQTNMTADPSGIAMGEGMLLKVEKSDVWPNGKWVLFPSVRMVSGEAFVTSSELGNSLASTHKARIVEMNGAGLLKALEGVGAKIMILRVISDHADENASGDFSSFTREYDGAGGKMVFEIARGLPVPPDDPAAHKELRKLLEDAAPE